MTRYGPSGQRDRRPLAEKYPGFSPYSYCAGNPINFVDPDGKFPETLWDIANVVMDVKSLASNLRQGKIGASIVDGVSLAFDAAAVVLPFVPGGVGSLVKAERGVGKTAGIVENAVDAAKSSGNAALRESATVGQEAHFREEIPIM